MKIFDCFKFFNELELLHLRFLEYYDIVDHFVIVESTKSHTGKSKELFFENNKDKFSKYLDKVIHVVVEDLPDYHVDDIWKAENFQRNCIQRGLDGVAEIGDKILVSDCDEFWDTDIFKQLMDCPVPYSFVQKLYYYWVNCIQNQDWCGTCCSPYGALPTPQVMRDFARGCNNSVAPGGWHYSFQGGPERIKTKVENIAESHLIINEVGDTDLITQRMENVVDLWGRTDDYAKKQLLDFSIEEYKPKKIQEFLEIYPDFYRKP